MDLPQVHYIVRIRMKCMLCGKEKIQEFWDREQWLMARAHIWLGKQLAEHRHKEQAQLVLEAEAESTPYIPLDRGTK